MHAVSKANEFLSLLVGKRYLSSISCFLLENGLFSKIPSIYSFNGHRSRPIKAHHVVDRVWLVAACTKFEDWNIWGIIPKRLPCSPVLVVPHIGIWRTGLDINKNLLPFPLWFHPESSSQKKLMPTTKASKGDMESKGDEPDNTTKVGNRSQRVPKVSLEKVPPGTIVLQFLIEHFPLNIHHHN